MFYIPATYISLRLNRQTYLCIHSLLIISLNARPLLIPRPLCACAGASQCLLIGLVYPPCAALTRLDPVYPYKHVQTCTILCRACYNPAGGHRDTLFTAICLWYESAFCGRGVYNTMAQHGVGLERMLQRALPKCN